MQATITGNSYANQIKQFTNARAVGAYVADIAIFFPTTARISSGETRGKFRQAKTNIMQPNYLFKKKNKFEQTHTLGKLRRGQNKSCGESRRQFFASRSRPSNSSFIIVLTSGTVRWSFFFKRKDFADSRGTFSVAIFIVGTSIDV